MISQRASIGQAGQAVGQHFPTQIVFGAQLGGLIDQNQDTPLIGVARQPRQRCLIIMAIDGVAIFDLELRAQRIAPDKRLDSSLDLPDQRAPTIANAKTRHFIGTIDRYDRDADVLQRQHRCGDGKQLNHPRGEHERWRVSIILRQRIRRS